MLRLSIVLVLSAAAFAQAPTVGGVLNTGDYSKNLCPGVIASVFGTNFGSGPASSVTVTVGGKAGSVSVVTPSQLTVQLPVDVSAGATTITVTVNNATSAPFNITLDAYAPAFFTADGSGAGAALIRTPAGGSITAAAPANPGDVLQAFTVGLGPTSPATPTGSTAAPNPTTIAPLLTIGGVSAAISYAGSSGIAGLYQINFTVPPGVQGTAPMVLTIGGKTTTAAVTLPLAGVSGVSNNASGSAGTVSPGAIVSVYANGIGTTNQTTGFPATAFQGYSVLFNGTPAPLFYLGGTGGQINLLVPYELAASGTVNIQLKTPTKTYPNFPVTMAPATPGLYTLTDPSTKTRFNVIAQFNATAWLAMPDGMAAALKIAGNCAASNISALSLCGQPAAAGDFLVMYTTGLGKATPNGDPNGAQLKTGDVPPADGSVLYKTVETPVVTIGGLPAKVVFSGIAPGFPGEYQVDFQVPAGITGDDVPLQITIGGKSDTRTIAIRAK